MISILVTGANGQLGSELKHIYKKALYKFDKPINFEFTDIETLDLSNLIFLKKFIQDHSFDFIINCAAYTNVDLAESDKDSAIKINSTCVKNIVDSIEKSHTKFIHISTDYVFDGNNHLPYTEEMPTSPTSVYGSSKLEGERIALKHDKTIVIRTSWLYSTFKNNFAKTIHKLSKEKESLSVVYDQIGTPTYAFDLAIAIFQIVDQSIRENNFAKGVYHYSNEGVCSWYDFAKIIVDKSYSKCKIIPIESKEYPTPVKRPFYSVLNKGKIKKTFHLEIPYWQDSLNEFFKNLNNN
ncbi:MAG: dTDP-4-dehydrorhamnose reductase [Marinilabiliales bacterium]|nr:MAG: dTDP-4-dehydrorhamnose reductase [Marinilabiliales bacterium]